MNKLIVKERFDKVFNLLAGYPNLHPEESKIRIELPLQNGQSQYLFNIKKEVSRMSEITLDRNDIFIPNSWTVMPVLRSDTNDQIEYLYPFVPVNDGTNPSIFQVAFENDNLEALYSGYLQWLVDNNVMLSAYPMEKFKKIPQTQGAFVLDSSNQAVQQGEQLEWNIDAVTELIIPRMTIAGTRDHKIAVNFNAAGLTFPCTSGYTPYLMLLMDGFLVKGGCEYIKGQNPFGDVVGQW